MSKGRSSAGGGGGCLTTLVLWFLVAWLAMDLEPKAAALWAVKASVLTVVVPLAGVLLVWGLSLAFVLVREELRARVGRNKRWESITRGDES